MLNDIKNSADVDKLRNGNLLPRHLELTVTAINSGAVRINHKNKVIENYTITNMTVLNSNNHGHK